MMIEKAQRLRKHLSFDLVHDAFLFSRKKEPQLENI